MAPDIERWLLIPDSLAVSTRRTLLSLLAAGSLGPAMSGLLEPETVDARKKKKKKNKNKKGGKGKNRCTGSVTGGASPSEETELLELINTFRANNGVAKPLTRQPQLDSSAASHSRDMAARCYFEHISPEGSDPFDRMLAAGYPGTPIAENIYMGSGKFTSAAQAFHAWETSTSGHREAMLDLDANQIGIGTALDGAGNMYWTNVFGQGD